MHDFKAVEHRLEYVATIRGVEYYNDSKATNVDATIKALESFPANIHLILGGKDKGSDYTVLNDLLRQRVKRVYTIGAAAAKIESQIVSSKRGPRNDHAETLETAIRPRPRLQPGDIVLLAPACASFDQFRNYEHRGGVQRSRKGAGRAGEPKELNPSAKSSDERPSAASCLRGEIKSSPWQSASVSMAGCSRSPCS